MTASEIETLDIRYEKLKFGEDESLEALNFLQNALMAYRPRNIREASAGCRALARKNISFLLPKRHGLYSAEVEGEFAGAVYFAKPMVLNYGEILLLAVKGDFQKIGIGYGLMEHAEKNLAESGTRRLIVDATSNATDFYTHHGYSQMSPGIRRHNPMQKQLPRAL